MLAVFGVLVIVPARLEAQQPRTQVGIGAAVDTRSHFDIHPHPSGFAGQIAVILEDTGAVAIAVVGGTGRTSARQVAPVFSKDDRSYSLLGGARFVVTASRWV